MADSLDQAVVQAAEETPERGYKGQDTSLPMAVALAAKAALEASLAGAAPTQEETK